MVTLVLDGLEYKLEPLKIYKDVPAEEVLRELKQPTGSGGLMMALYHYRLMLTQGEKGFARAALLLRRHRAVLSAADRRQPAPSA